MLSRVLSTKRWIALVLLTAGVVVVQLPARDPTEFQEPKSELNFPRSAHEMGSIATGAAEVARELTKRGLEKIAGGLAGRSASYEGIEKDLGLVKPDMNYSLGLTSVLAAAVISGLTGVYFEKVLKQSNTNATVWIRNVQLSFYSLFPSLLIGVLFKDGEEVYKNGFFDGYNAVVWAAILFQALGGILVAMCINYADNIAKNFATSISIIFSFLISLVFLDFKVTYTVSLYYELLSSQLINLTASQFLIGTVLVISATYLYSGPDRKGNRPAPLNLASYEKTTIDGEYTPNDDMTLRVPIDPLDPIKSAGLSSSRPGSPMRHHARVGSARIKIKRED